MEKKLSSIFSPIKIIGNSSPQHIEKDTNLLKYQSDWPYRHQIVSVKILINRVNLMASSTKIFFKELPNMKQIFCNNSFANNIIYEQIKLLLWTMNQSDIYKNKFKFINTISLF